MILRSTFWSGGKNNNKRENRVAGFTSTADHMFFHIVDLHWRSPTRVRRGGLLLMKDTKTYEDDTSSNTYVPGHGYYSSATESVAGDLFVSFLIIAFSSQLNRRRRFTLIDF